MLTSTGYWIAFVLEAAVCATAAFIAARRGGTARAYGVAWLVSAFILGVFGYLDWSAQPVEETGLATYVLEATLVPLAAVGSVILMQQSRGLIRWSTAVIASFLVNIAVVIVGFLWGF